MRKLLEGARHEHPARVRMPEKCNFIEALWASIKLNPAQRDLELALKLHLKPANITLIYPLYYTTKSQYATMFNRSYIICTQISLIIKSSIIHVNFSPPLTEPIGIGSFFLQKSQF